MALRVANSGYSTIAADAAFVIASVPPLSIKAEERVHRHNGMETTEAENRLLDQWQERWSSSQKGACTRTLIPDVAQWVKRRHGEPNFFLTQFLPGHGDFQKYLFRMQKTESENCRY
ncbi:uncharacterized protein LOC124355562 [Homalodisca vitripennis]|uniref:uncharacterized protein LOC124355562 n=1 Tax=Homalodisca vitripennis TaxID=197043 RepID=UPI001EE9CB76|nr:uncharacterized protein LOC124355562 [Homalodisca vitripennis]